MKRRKWEKNALRWVKYQWCKIFHRKDHVCWDTVWKNVGAGKPELFLPGKCTWYCNKCGRDWATVNPHVFPGDCADDQGVLPKKYYRKYPPEIRIRKCKCQCGKGK